nr:MAG TPA: hypothetical protein [Bacteriophage sp.]
MISISFSTLSFCCVLADTSGVVADTSFETLLAISAMSSSVNSVVVYIALCSKSNLPALFRWLTISKIEAVLASLYSFSSSCITALSITSLK